MAIPNVQDFMTEIELLKRDVKEDGEDHVDICAKTLHEMLGDPKGKDARMKSCCQAMYNCMKTGDKVLELPRPVAGKTESSGFGSRLAVRYYV